MTLRQAGLTYAAIAAELGYYDAKGAERAVAAGLQAAGREIAIDLLPLELDRLDRMQAGLWGEAIAGDIPSVLAVLKIMERRAKYAGLDAPTKAQLDIDQHQQVDVNVSGGVLVIQGDKDEYIAQLRAIRGDPPLAIEGTSTVIPNGQQTDMSPDGDDDGL
jgi:hypothetical protein